jgi:hypothetical protein
MIHDNMKTSWTEFVNNRPDGWGEGLDLDEKWPLVISIRYGQNAKLCTESAMFENEAREWEIGRSYENIAYLSFALATHIRSGQKTPSHLIDD